LKRRYFFLLIALMSPAFGQTSEVIRAETRHDGAGTPGLDTSGVPVRTLEFEAVETGPSIDVSPVTSFPVHCDSDGSLFLDMLDPKDLGKHTVISIHGKVTKTYSPSGISDLHDVRLLDFFPSESGVVFLVRGSRELPGQGGAGKSPAGIPWSKYRNYIAVFDHDGSYKGSKELPMNYSLSRVAVFPSGNYLVSGYDRVNSTLRLLYLKSSGEIARNLDLPASRGIADVNSPFGSGDSMMEANKLLGAVVFTEYKQDILAWRRNSNDAILDIGPGGSAREVPLQPPVGYTFVDLITSSDRWVAHFRSRKVTEDSPLNQADYSYYDLRPQDASLASRLVQVGVIPLSIACEIDGKYISFMRDKSDKFVMLEAR
jgi:hypothetical protein